MREGGELFEDTREVLVEDPEVVEDTGAVVATSVTIKLDGTTRV